MLFGTDQNSASGKLACFKVTSPWCIRACIYIIFEVRTDFYGMQYPLIYRNNIQCMTEL